MARWITPKRRLAIYIRDGFECLYCGRDLRSEDPEELNLDHLKCRSKGGSNHETNLVTSCQRCNKSRGVRPWTEFAPGGAHERIRRNRRRKLNIKLAEELLADRTGKHDR